MHADPVNLHRTRVRSHQTDLNGAMYHARFFDIFDDARIETFRRLGYTYEQFKAEGWVLVIRRVECDFRMPALMDDVLTVTIQVERFTRATMVARFECRRDGDLVASGRTTYAFLDMSGRPRAVPERVRALAESAPGLMITSP